eukprot:585194-Rhodomonas_salina.3
MYKTPGSSTGYGARRGVVQTWTRSWRLPSSSESRTSEAVAAYPTSQLCTTAIALQLCTSEKKAKVNTAPRNQRQNNAFAVQSVVGQWSVAIDSDLGEHEALLAGEEGRGLLLDVEEEEEVPTWVVLEPNVLVEPDPMLVQREAVQVAHEAVLLQVVFRSLRASDPLSVPDSA